MAAWQSRGIAPPCFAPTERFDKEKICLWIPAWKSTSKLENPYYILNSWNWYQDYSHIPGARKKSGGDKQ
jgi:hypothetical protein